MTEWQILVDSINLISNRIMIFCAIFCAVALTLSFIFHKIEGLFHESMAKKIENFLSMSTIWFFNFGVLYSIVFFSI